MKISDMKTLNGFLGAVDKCGGNVYLISTFGDKYNLKSALSKYIAIGELLSENGDKLELFCEQKGDEGYFMEFFENNPAVL